MTPRHVLSAVVLPAVSTVLLVLFVWRVAG